MHLFLQSAFSSPSFQPSQTESCYPCSSCLPLPFKVSKNILQHLYYYSNSHEII